VLFDVLQDRPDAEKVDPAPPVTDDNVIRKKGNSPDVVEMGMGDKNILYFELCFFIEDIGETARVKQGLVIQKESRRIVTGKLRPRTPQDLNLHLPGEGWSRSVASSPF